MTEDKECLPQLQRSGREQSSSFVLPEGTCCSLHNFFFKIKTRTLQLLMRGFGSGFNFVTESGNGF